MNRTVAIILALMLMAIPAAAADTDDPSKGQLLSAYSQAIYYEGHKVGYRTVSIHRLPGGGHRLKVNEFLKTRASASQARYFMVLEEEVDDRGRPRSIECRTVSGSRVWTVSGRAEDGEFLMERTVGEKKATARIPLEDDVVPAAWAVFQPILGSVREERYQLRLVDERLGGLVPDVCLVQVVGRGRVEGPGGQTLTGESVVRRCGPTETLYLIDGRGQILREMGRSAPFAAEMVPAREAMDMAAGRTGPRPEGIEGLASNRYRSDRFGYEVFVPRYPFVAHASPGGGAVRIADVTDEASVTVRPGTSGSLAAIGAADGDRLIELAEAAHRQWASRWDEVEVREPRLSRLAGRQAALIEGRATLGCATHFFRHTFLVSRGVAFLVTARVVDRPLSRRPELLDPIAVSLELSAPEGRLPIVVSGDRLRVPYYGFELRRPGSAWKVPARLGGPATALELVRADGSAICVVRVMTPTGDDDLEEFVTDRAQGVGMGLAATDPKPQKDILGGRKALRLTYEGDLLNDRPSRCDALYTMLRGQVFAMLLLSEDETIEARRELDRIRRSLRFIRQGEGEG